MRLHNPEIMNKSVSVRLVAEGDADRFLEWSLTTPNNQFDPQVVKYPNTFVLCAETPDKVVCYLPVQRPLCMESIARNPEATPQEMAVALRELTAMVATLAQKSGSGEMYFLATEETVEKFAEGRKFEKLPWTLYRARVDEWLERYGTRELEQEAECV